MAGYGLVLKIKKIEEWCSTLGFMLCHTRYNNSSHNYGDRVAIKPKDKDSLPVYSRDAELFCGTIEELEVFLCGVEWARNYDTMVFGKTHDKKRLRKEQDVRNENLVKALKGQDLDRPTN